MGFLFSLRFIMNKEKKRALPDYSRLQFIINIAHQIKIVKCLYECVLTALNRLIILLSFMIRAISGFLWYNHMHANRHRIRRERERERIIIKKRQTLRFRERDRKKISFMLCRLCLPYLSLQHWTVAYVLSMSSLRVQWGSARQ